MKYIISFIFILLGTLSGYAQDCTDYHQFHCQYADYTFYYSRQSKSALFERGQTSELRVVAYGGEDYFISICANRKWPHMRFRILEDNEDRTVLYDNLDYDYAESVTIENDITRNIIIEVTSPDPEKPAEVGEKRCVGVVLMFRPSGQSGGEGGDGRMGF
jgi:hypothetical protein